MVCYLISKKQEVRSDMKVFNQIKWAIIAIVSIMVAYHVFSEYMIPNFLLFKENMKHFEFENMTFRHGLIFTTLALYILTSTAEYSILRLFLGNKTAKKYSENGLLKYLVILSIFVAGVTLMVSTAVIAPVWGVNFALNAFFPFSFAVVLSFTFIHASVFGLIVELT